MISMRVLPLIIVGLGLLGCAQERVVILEGERFDPAVVEQAPPIPSPAPPAPRLRLIQMQSALATPRSEEATQTLIASLAGSHFSFATAPAAPISLAECDVSSANFDRCIGGRLLEAGAEPGTVALVATETPDGSLHWLCVGADREGFVAERQSVQWPNAVLSPDRPWTRDERSTAAACLSYAGRQSGW